MGTVHYTAPADLPADEAFTFMADAANLPRLLPPATEEAWVRADKGNRRLLWGTASDDHGMLQVADLGANLCEIEISVTTGRTDTERVREELAQAVAALAHKAGADADVS